MKIYTVQMAKWRKVKERGVELIDTTVKSGLRTFAPTWDMVQRIKAATAENRELEEKIYTVAYNRMMRLSYTNDRQAWLDLLGKEEIAIACYCADGLFCHRHLLIKYLLAVADANGIEATYEGEIK